MIGWILFKQWLSEITVWMISQNSFKTKKKNTESRPDEDENIQSKNGPLRVHIINSKLQNRKLTGRRTMNDEERTKNGKEHSRIWLQKCYPRPWFSSSFSFFSIILSEICFPKVLNPFLQPPTPFPKRKLFSTTSRRGVPKQSSSAAPSKRSSSWSWSFYRSWSLNWFLQKPIHLQ